MIKILINSRDNIDNLNFFDQRFSISKSLNYDFFFEKGIQKKHYKSFERHV